MSQLQPPISPWIAHARPAAPVTGGLARVVMAAMAVCLATGAIGLAIARRSLGVLHGLDGTGATELRLASLSSIGRFSAGTGIALRVLGSVGSIGGGLLFAAWLSRSTQTLERMGRPGRWSAGWGWGAWFVPGLNLFVGRAMVLHLWSVVGEATEPPTAPGTVSPRRPRVVIELWWWTFVGSFVLNIVAGLVAAVVAIGSASRAPDASSATISLGYARRVAMAGVISGWLSLVAAVCVLLVLWVLPPTLDRWTGSRPTPAPTVPSIVDLGARSAATALIAALFIAGLVGLATPEAGVGGGSTAGCCANIAKQSAIGVRVLATSTEVASVVEVPPRSYPKRTNAVEPQGGCSNPVEPVHPPPALP